MLGEKLEDLRLISSWQLRTYTYVRTNMFEKYSDLRTEQIESIRTHNKKKK